MSYFDQKIVDFLEVDFGHFGSLFESFTKGEVVCMECRESGRVLS